MSVVWGVNGHIAYTASAADQLALVDSIGFQSYRVDTYDATTTTISKLSALASAASPYGIGILPIIIPSASASTSETNAYNYGYATAHTLASTFTGMTWEMGNELDTLCLSTGDGTHTTDYDTASYQICRGAIRGIYAGLKAADSTAKGCVDITGQHFGFLDRLASDGVSWDITGSHYYSPDTLGIASGVGPLYARFAQYNKPIAVTEFNRIDGSYNNHAQDESDVIIAMAQGIDSVSSQYNIIAAYVYELLDEPGKSGGEAYYGVATSSGTLKTAGQAIKNTLNP